MDTISSPSPLVFDKQHIAQLILQDLQREDVFPVGALCAAKHVSNEIEAHLIEVLNKDYVSVKKGGDTSIMSFYALYLLNEFRSKKLYPILLRIFYLTEEQLDIFIGDALTEALARMTAANFSGTVETFFEIFENKKLYEFARTAALDVILLLFIHDTVDHNLVISHIETRLKKAIETEDFEDVTELVSFVMDARIQKLYDLAYYAFDHDLIDLMHYDRKWFEERCNEPIEKDYKFHNFIDSAYLDLKSWTSLGKLKPIALGGFL